MSFQKANQVIELAMWMQRRSDGVTLKEIADQFEVSEQSARRMKNAVEDVFFDVESAPSDTKERRWRLSPGRLERLVGVSTSDLVALENAEKILSREGMRDDADRISKLGRKIRTVLPSRDRIRIEPDLELLTESESFVARPGPILPIADGLYERLKQAILGANRIKITYLSRKGEKTYPTVEPYGFLFGHRHYLLAVNPSKDPQELRNYSLAGIHDVEVLNGSFARDNAINVQAHSRRSFGIFVEDDGPFEIVWKFRPEAAANAAEFLFHPDQISELLEDGSLIVKFVAGGMIEMAWHLLTWGPNVEVIKPTALKKLVHPLRHDWGVLP